jgi:D-alanyl-D-alanine carboxypeptidase/D-alanyl-D-alanine-endopeptidase (penicillin-binding protein 4)
MGISRWLAVAVLGLYFSCLPSLGQAGPLPKEVAHALRDAGIPLDAVSIVVQTVGGHAPHLVLNENVPRNPASLMKLVTTYSALVSLGPAKTWKTSIQGLPPDGDGIVRGDIYIVGSGDPHLTLEDWGALLRSLRIRGIREIQGDVILDDTFFQVPPSNPDDFDHKGYRAYNVSPAALQVGFKALTLSFEVVEGKVLALPNFDLPGVSINNALKSQAGPCPNDWKSTLDQAVQDDGHQATISLAGVFIEGCSGKTLAYSVLDNSHYLAASFRKLWSELGGIVTGTLRTGAASPGLPILAQHESPSLADQIREINKFSNNVMARTLFLDLGVDGEGKPGGLEQSKARAKQILQGQHLDFPELIIENGAGLSRVDRISASHLAALLIAAAQGPYQAEFISSLPIAGMDGTAEKQALDDDLRGRFHLKTGSLEGVKGVAGYGLTQHGKLVSVVLLVNHPQASASGVAQRALLRWIARNL